ncbi:ATP-dependent RNA helicase DHX36 [Orchesella cincta]|uniref:RNA helicase n=1 Tax=Orchesella cincta TaxID=48709 RepID=A0A1D2M9Q2_ORCCI|nr:ATP-dependent RNA helicase DHX36 [Orchesella cincta]
MSGRGRGRGRGGRGRGGGRGHSSSSAEYSQSAGGGRGGRGRHPPHLKGREIGLWYASKQIPFVKQETRPTIELSLSKQAKITGLLDQLERHSKAKVLEAAYENSDFMKRYRQNVEKNVNAAAARIIPNSEVTVALLRVPEVDSSLKDELDRKQANSKYQNMLRFREKLPAYQHRNEFLKCWLRIKLFCGKTTQCCQLILDEMIQAGNGSLCNIVCTQPRRISAISVAERVAEERDEGIGQKSVGYSIRLESRLPQRTRGSILFCTTGVVFQYLKDDPKLTRFSHVVVDEIHERDVLSDFLITILKDLINIRPDLKVILMSATINADQFSRIHISVKEYYLEDVLAQTRFTFETKDNKQQQQPWRGRGRKKYMKDEEIEARKMLESHVRKLERDRAYPRQVLHELLKPEAEEINLDLIITLLLHICETDRDNGAVLIFVPGWDQISKLNTQLQSSGKFPGGNYLIIPLHSMMPTVNQKEVFNRPSGGRRKIIIATNIAETSITIDDIVFVIDVGKIKMTNFDISKNLETLDTEWVSLANAKQRKGRAGRVQDGVCYHLYTKAREMTLERFKKPEILRKRLEEVVLQIKTLNLGMAAAFLRRLLDSPSSKSVDLAVERLIQLHALDGEENLTPLGFHLAQLPMDPQTGKMILMAGIFGCVDPILSVAASLSFKDPFYIPLGQEKNVDRARKLLADGTKSDHYITIRAIEGYEKACRERRERDFCYRNFLSGNTLQLLINMKNQFAEHLHQMKYMSTSNVGDAENNVNSDNVGIVKAIICAGLYPNIATIHVKRANGTCTFPKFRTREDGKVDLHPKSVNSGEDNFESHYLAYYQKMKTASLYLYDTTMITPFPLLFFGGQLSFMKEKKLGVVSVDHNLDFLIEKHVFDLVQALRKHLDKLLEEKIVNPGPTCWNELSKEGALMRAIIEVITAEYCEMLGENPSEDSDSDDY